MSADIEQDDDGIIKLGTKNFEGFTSGHTLTLVAFIAPWCGHCKRFKSEFAAAAEELKDEDNIAFVRVDCVAHEKLYDKFKVKGFPTVKLFRHGILSDTYDFARKVRLFKVNVCQTRNTEIAEPLYVCILPQIFMDIHN